MSELVIKIIEYVCYLLLLLTIYLIVRKVFARSNILLPLLGIVAIDSIAFWLNLNLLSKISSALLAGVVVAIVIANDQKINKIMKRKKSSKEIANVSEERKQLYKIINNTVAALSSSRTGAIMTFEKNNSLNEYINKGVKVDAPVSMELLTTIFYEGTTLHDGAVIIRGNTIVAASVYYVPTVKAMNGKYGARHRASLGISEVCDAVTVVVSEETGRISLAVDGELQAVTRENFLQNFKREMEK